MTNEANSNRTSVTREPTAAALALMQGPQNNDLALQLRKHGIGKVILAGMSANLCVESHLRDLIERGFEVAVVKDATAAAKHPDMGDGYEAAMVNFRYIASDVLSTDDATSAISNM